MPGFHTKVKFSRSLSLLGHDFWGHTQIPLGVYKGLLKFTSYTAGGMAASGNLLGGRHQQSDLKALQWTAPSTVPLPAVY